MEEHKTDIDDMWEELTSSGGGAAMSTRLQLEVLVMLHDDAVKIADEGPDYFFED